VNSLKNRRFLAIWLLVCAILSSCAAPAHEKHREKLIPEIDILKMKDDSETAIQITRQIQVDLTEIKERLNNLEARQNHLDTIVYQLPLARLEEFENRLVLLNEETLRLKELIEGKNSLKTFSLKKKPKPEPAPDKLPLSYKRAMVELQKKNFPLAISVFEEFIKNEKGNHYTDDAWFWIGESYFDLGDYQKARDAYLKVFEYQKTDKKDDAQFKTALSYLRSGDSKQAIAEFKKLNVIYPDSEYISRAKSELLKLNVDL
jgi:TolA-binding protein